MHTYITYACCLRKQSIFVCIENFLRKLGANSRYYLPSSSCVISSLTISRVMKLTLTHAPCKRVILWMQGKPVYCVTFHTICNVVNFIIPHEDRLKIKQKSALPKLKRKVSARNINLSNVMEQMEKQI